MPVSIGNFTGVIDSTPLSAGGFSRPVVSGTPVNSSQNVLSLCLPIGHRPFSLGAGKRVKTGCLRHLVYLDVVQPLSYSRAQLERLLLGHFDLEVTAGVVDLALARPSAFVRHPQRSLLFYF